MTTTPSVTALNQSDAMKMLVAASAIDMPAFLATPGVPPVEQVAGLAAPYAVKIDSAAVSHKSELRLVEIGLQTPQAAVEASVRILDRCRDAGISYDGIIVQSMVQGALAEFIVSVDRDETFGRVLAVGSGGVFVELLDDIQFAVLPVSHRDIQRLLAPLVGRRLLEGWRGSEAGDVNALIDAVGRVAQFAEQNPNVVRLELNPVVCTRDGGCLAVDVVLEVEA